MSHAPHAVEEGHPTPRKYVEIGAILAIITAIEVANLLYRCVASHSHTGFSDPLGRQVCDSSYVLHASEVR